MDTIGDVEKRREEAINKAREEISNIAEQRTAIATCLKETKTAGSKLTKKLTYAKAELRQAWARFNEALFWMDQAEVVLMATEARAKDILKQLEEGEYRG